jgi:hypothetical protein
VELTPIAAVISATVGGIPLAATVSLMKSRISFWRSVSCSIFFPELFNQRFVTKVFLSVNTAYMSSVFMDSIGRRLGDIKPENKLFFMASW